MNIHKMMHDLGMKITNDIMDPIISGFQQDIESVQEHIVLIEAKLDKIIELLEDK